MVGAHAMALELRLRAMQISPLDPWAFDTYLGIAFEHLFALRFREAKSWADRALSEKPDSLPALVIKAASMASAEFPAEEIADAVQDILQFDRAYQSPERAGQCGFSGRRTPKFSWQVCGRPGYLRNNGTTLRRPHRLQGDRSLVARVDAPDRASSGLSPQPPPSAGTTRSRAGGLPKFERSEPRRRQRSPRAARLPCHPPAG
jgi:hypothetical protein